MLFINISEVTKALNRTRVLYKSWNDQNRQEITFSKDNIQHTLTDLRSSIRSIEWDLEDLEDTIGIAIQLG